MTDEFEPHHWADRFLFSIFRDLYPIDERAMNRRYRGVDLYSQYWGWFLGAMSLGCVTRCLLTAGLLFGGYWLMQAHPPATSTEFVVVRELHPLWIIPALAVGTILGGVAADLLVRLSLGQRYREFSDFCQWKCGFDGRKAGRLMLAVIVPVSLCVTLILINSYWVIGQGSLQIRSLWSVREFAYSDVIAIVQDDIHRNPISGETRTKPQSTMVLHFRDGQQFRWVNDWSCGCNPSRREWQGWLSEATHVPVTHLTRHADYQPTVLAAH